MGFCKEEGISINQRKSNQDSVLIIQFKYNDSNNDDEKYHIVQEKMNKKYGITIQPYHRNAHSLACKEAKNMGNGKIPIALISIRTVETKGPHMRHPLCEFKPGPPHIPHSPPPDRQTTHMRPENPAATPP